MITLSSEHSEFKPCPNCHGEGTENNPPLRRCGVCKGSGRVVDQAPVHAVGPEIQRRRRARRASEDGMPVRAGGEEKDVNTKKLLDL